MSTRSSRFLPTLRAQSRVVTKTATPGEKILSRLLPYSAYASAWGGMRVEQVQHYLDWVFIGIHAIASKMASATPNMAYVGDDEKPGVTVKANRRALCNLVGRGFGGSYEVDTNYGTSKHSPVTTSRSLPGGFGGGGGSFLTVGEYYGKALSVIKPHEHLEPLETNHLYRRLTDNPNPTDTFFDYQYERIMFLYLTGSSYEWVIPNNFGRPCEKWVIPSHWVWPRTGDGRTVDEEHQDADRMIAYYEVRPFGVPGSAGMLTLPPSEVVWTRFKSPLSKLDGYSRLWAVNRWIDTEESITKSRWAQFINKARPELWIELGPGYEDPDDNMIARLEAKIAQKHQGEFNTGKPLITPSGAKAQVLSFSPNEMDYIQSEDQMAGNILSAMGVPKASVGLVQDMTFGSILATLMGMCEQCLNPLGVMLGQTETKQLASRWDERAPAWSTTTAGGHGGAASERRVKLWYDNFTPADPAQVNSDIQADGQGYAMTPNEIRALRGRAPYKLGGNNPLVTGPAGIMEFPINEEARMDDIGQMVAQYTSQLAADKDVTKLGTQESNEDIPKEEVDGQLGGQHGGNPNSAGNGSTGSVTGVDDEDLNDGGAVDEPNGKPSKQHKDLGWSFHGVDCDKATYDRWKQTKDAGHCPWCGTTLKRNHNNANAHLRTCPDKPDINAGRVGKVLQRRKQLVAAGLALVAEDTGRVLMLQRPLEDGDPNGGKWEFPGGHIDEGEAPFDAACREWEEEVGVPFADLNKDDYGASWDGKNDKYRGHVVHIPTEDMVDLVNRDLTRNPDGDDFAAVAWVGPGDFNNHNLRPALLEDIDAVLAAVVKTLGKRQVAKGWLRRQGKWVPIKGGPRASLPIRDTGKLRQSVVVAKAVVKTEAELYDEARAKIEKALEGAS